MAAAGKGRQRGCLALKFCGAGVRGRAIVGLGERGSGARRAGSSLGPPPQPALLRAGVQLLHFTCLTLLKLFL